MKRISNALLTSFFLLFFCHGEIISQIGAEAQGGKMTMWLAMGLDKEISSRWLSVTDLGYGRHSDPNNYAFSKRQGLYVITQDFVFRPNTHWSYFFSFGYWRRNFYSDDTPYDGRSTPYEYRNEIRPFQRISYNHTVNSIKVSHTLRTDYRVYYDQDFKSSWSTPFEFRLRYLEKWKIPLSQNNWVIIIDELLSSIDQNDAATRNASGKTWSLYQFTENRLSLYYRRSILNRTVDLDFGIMHQYWREKPGISNFNTSYNLMIDVIFRDPFRKNK